MSVSGNRRRSLRDRVLGAAGAVVAAGLLAACGAAGPGAGPGSARASAPGPCPQAGSPAPGQAGSPTVSGDLYGVAALPAGGVWAVGSTILTDPVAMHSNGSAWTERVLTLNPGHPGDPPGSFQAVAAVSARDAWAVGVNAGKPLAEHWNGQAWTVVPTPSPGSDGRGAFLQGVAAVSARDIWAVGGTNYDTTWIIHWDGTAWTRVPSPNPAGSNAYLYGVAAASPASAWAVGSYTTTTGTDRPLIEHWDGRAWKLVPGPAIRGGGTFTAVSAASPASAWAVGGGGLIEHWDGRAWTRAASPSLPGGGTLNGVVALSPTSAWAVGTGSLCSRQLTVTAVIEHWDGRAWTLVPSPATGRLTAVTAASPASAWAVGCSELCNDSTALIEHWDGKSLDLALCAIPSGPGGHAPSAPQQLRLKLEVTQARSPNPSTLPR